jgi:hypothetical protein
MTMTIPSDEAAQFRTFDDISKTFDNLLGGTLAAGAAVLKANSQLGIAKLRVRYRRQTAHD